MSATLAFDTMEAEARAIKRRMPRAIVWGAVKGSRLIVRADRDRKAMWEAFKAGWLIVEVQS